VALKEIVRDSIRTAKMQVYKKEQMTKTPNVPQCRYAMQMNQGSEMSREFGPRLRATSKTQTPNAV
jgi:hypothetical protein